MKKIKNPMPESGIWYYVWLKPHWHIVAKFGEDSRHVTMWRDEIVAQIIKHYKIRDHDDKISLKSLSTSLPRGRVYVEYHEAIVAHGDDFPSMIDKAAELRKIVSEFGLSNLFIRKKVKIEMSSHETMSTYEQGRLQEIIGDIPY